MGTIRVIFNKRFTSLQLCDAEYKKLSENSEMQMIFVNLVERLIQNIFTGGVSKPKADIFSGLK